MLDFIATVVVSVVGGVSGSATGELRHYGSHPRPQVADRGMPSRMDIGQEGSTG